MSSPNLTLVIQTISVTWTKEARGEPLATPRNRVPEIAALPSQPAPPRKPKVAAPQSQYVRHAIEWGERNEFRQPLSDKIETLDFTGEIKNRLLGFYQEVNDSLIVALNSAYSYKSKRQVIMDYTRMGAPPRAVPLIFFSLKPGEWGQVRYNGRFSWDMGWKYEKWVFNIGLFEGPVPEDCFNGAPAHSFSSMADLW